MVLPDDRQRRLGLYAVAITQLYDVSYRRREMRRLISQTNRKRLPLHSQIAPTGQFIKAILHEVMYAGLDPKTGKPIDYDSTQDGSGLCRQGDQVRHKRSTWRPEPHYGMPTFMPNTYDASRGFTYFQAMIAPSQLLQLPTPDPGKGVPGAGSGRSSAGRYQGQRRGTARNAHDCCKVSHGLSRRHLMSAPERGEKLESYYPAYSGVLGTAEAFSSCGRHHGKISPSTKTPCRSCGASIPNANSPGIR